MTISWFPHTDRSQGSGRHFFKVGWFHWIPYDFRAQPLSPCLILESDVVNFRSFPFGKWWSFFTTSYLKNTSQTMGIVIPLMEDSEIRDYLATLHWSVISPIRVDSVAYLAKRYSKIPARGLVWNLTRWGSSCPAPFFSKLNDLVFAFFVMVFFLFLIAFGDLVFFDFEKTF